MKKLVSLLAFPLIFLCLLQASAFGENRITEYDYNGELVNALIGYDFQPLDLDEGSYTINGYLGQPEANVTLTGSGDGTLVCVVNDGSAGSSTQAFENAYVSMSNMTVTADDNNSGFVGTNSLSFAGCVFNKYFCYWGSNGAIFSNCSFTPSYSENSFGTADGSNFTFAGCTFNAPVNLTTSNSGAGTVNISGCTFGSGLINSPAGAGNWIVNISGSNTFNGATLTREALVSALGSVKNFGLTVTLDGETVWTNGAAVQQPDPEPSPDPSPSVYYKIEVSSSSASGMTVAHVSGGGRIASGESTTVTAPSIAGYSFSGWYSSADENCQSTEQTYTFYPTCDCTMTAKYVAETGYTFGLAIDADSYSVEGATGADGAYSCIPGSSITVSYTGSNTFKYWVNGSDKVVSTDAIYSFNIGSYTSLKAKTYEQQSSKATVAFLNAYGQVISTAEYTTGLVASDITYPEAPFKLGYKFTGWSATADEIASAINAGSEYIEVKPQYTTEENIFIVAVNCSGDGLNAESKTIAVQKGKYVAVEAETIEGYSFSCWKIEGVIIGTTESITISPMQNTTLIAVYVKTGEATEAKQPIINLTEVVNSYNTDTGKYTVTFIATRSVSDGYAVVEQGILYSPSEFNPLQASPFKTDGGLVEGIYKSSDSKTDLTGTFALNINTAAENKTFYAAGYMILRNSNNELVYIYSPVKSGTASK